LKLSVRKFSFGLCIPASGNEKPVEKDWILLILSSEVTAPIEPPINFSFGSLLKIFFNIAKPVSNFLVEMLIMLQLFYHGLFLNLKIEMEKF